MGTKTASLSAAGIELELIEVWIWSAIWVHPFIEVVGNVEGRIQVPGILEIQKLKITSLLNQHVVVVQVVVVQPGPVVKGPKLRGDALDGVFGPNVLVTGSSTLQPFFDATLLEVC
eukprot:Skav202774  [mRNA]  locus=scaffold326:327505:336417:+ [translate_table: standard]